MHENNMFDRSQCRRCGQHLRSFALIDFHRLSRNVVGFRWNFCTVHLGASEECSGNIRGTSFDIFKRNRTAASHCDRAKYFCRVGSLRTWLLAHKPPTIIAFNQTETLDDCVCTDSRINRGWNKCCLRNTNWSSVSTLRGYACVRFFHRVCGSDLSLLIDRTVSAK